MTGRDFGNMMPAAVSEVDPRTTITSAQAARFSADFFGAPGLTWSPACRPKELP